jgi:hypothetical protein
VRPVSCIVLAFTLAGAGCADDAPHVRVGTAAGFRAPARATVSVFGVFHDGRMSEASWHPLSAKVSRALGTSACSVGWGSGLRSAEPELARWVDAETRENGVTDALLGRVAAQARGDFVMTLMVYRYMPRSQSRAAAGVARTRALAAPPMRRRGFGRVGPRVLEEPEARVFELSASLYSVRQHALVAEIELRYAGEDLDVAMQAFATKLAAVVPGASCVGWKWPEPAPSSDDDDVATEPTP